MSNLKSHYNAMTRFRRLQLAVLAASTLLGESANAQLILCNATSGVPPIVRDAGATELVGDIVMSCTGGVPTLAGEQIPQINITIALNTNVTSRLLSGSSTAGGVSEAILSIDEPFPSGSQVPSSVLPTPGAPTTQLGCVADNSTNCAIPGTGGGSGAAGPYNGSTGHFNLFQGSWSTAHPQEITWTGVPLDGGEHIIRVTNLRANASVFNCLSGISPVPIQISEFISITGTQSVAINNTQLTVAFVYPGLVSSTSPTGDVSAAEGFASAFKPMNFIQYGGTSTSPIFPGSANALENVLGFDYNSESGFVTSAAGLSGDGITPGALGLADAGTELAFNFSGPPNGTPITVPDLIYLYPLALKSSVTAATGSTGATGVAVLLGGTGFGPGLTTQLAISSGSATATYEVLLANPSVVEFAFLPNPGAAVTTSVSFGPKANGITYRVNQTIGGGSVKGVIGTDGTIGTLGQANITGYNLLVNDGTNTFDLSCCDFFPFSGSDLSATATQLLFNFSGTDGVLDITDPSLDFQVCFSTVSCLSSGGGEAIRFLGLDGFHTQFTNLTGSHVIGSVTSALPIPSFMGASVCPVPIPSTAVAITASGLLFSRVTQTYGGTVTVKNISGATIEGPIQLVLAGLPNGVFLKNASNTFVQYVTLPAASLSPGSSVTVNVQFSAPLGTRITFVPSVYSGSF
jgi:hypothetical protein